MIKISFTKRDKNMSEVEKLAQTVHLGIWVYLITDATVSVLKFFGAI